MFSGFDSDFLYFQNQDHVYTLHYDKTLVWTQTQSTATALSTSSTPSFEISTITPDWNWVSDLHTPNVYYSYKFSKTSISSIVSDKDLLACSLVQRGNKLRTWHGDYDLPLNVLHQHWNVNQKTGLAFGTLV